MNVAQTVVVLDGSGGGGAPIVNRYAQFNGVNDYATIPAITHTIAAGTVMVRCKLDVATPASSATSALFDYGIIGTNSYYVWTTGEAYSTTFVTSRIGPFATSGLITRTNWHWVVIRDNAASGWEYLQAKDDGTLISLATGSHVAWATSPVSRLLGANFSGSKLDGSLDRFLVGDSRWSDAQIQAVIAGGNGPGDALVRFEFNEISGGTFLDSSGNGKHATITGSPVITDF